MNFKTSVFFGVQVFFPNNDISMHDLVFILVLANLYFILSEFWPIHYRREVAPEVVV